eukprot:c25939_g2_i2 orf=49-702(+)
MVESFRVDAKGRYVVRYMNVGNGRLGNSVPSLARNVSLLGQTDVDPVETQQRFEKTRSPSDESSQHQQSETLPKSACSPQQQRRATSYHGATNGSESSLEGQMRELEDLLSKLNPLAKEFVPPSLLDGDSSISNAGAGAAVGAASKMNSRKKNKYNQGKKKVNFRITRAQREESIRRTVYVSDIDQQVHNSIRLQHSLYYMAAQCDRENLDECLYFT